MNFLLTATNHHGVHSPFVFDYVTHCLYAKPDYPEKTALNILLKTIHHFKAGRIWLPEESLSKERHSEAGHSRKEYLKYGDSDRARVITEKIRKTYPDILLNESPFDAILTTIARARERLESASEANEIHNDTFMMIEGMYHSSQSQTDWQRLKKNPKVTVTIDLFHCALVFFRKEQAEEHFKIRI